jgi:hypothetical protein
MYQAKADGRARCVVFESPDESTAPAPSPAEVNMTLAHVAVSVTRREREINDLWRQSIDLRNEPLAHRLAQISHALHTATVALRENSTIG